MTQTKAHTHLTGQMLVLALNLRDLCSSHRLEALNKALCGVVDACSDVDELTDMEREWLAGIKRDARHARMTLYPLLNLLKDIEDSTIDIKGDIAQTIKEASKA